MKSLSILNAYLNAREELFKLPKVQMLPAPEAKKSLRTSIQTLIAEVQNSLQKALEPILVPNEKWKSLVESIPKALLEIPSESQVVEGVREALLLLGTQGWYVDLEMPAISYLAIKNSFAEGYASEVEEAFVKYFEDQLSIIETSIIERFPHRKHLIQPAFIAHRRQEYVLSIPILFAQADGICMEVVGQHLFMKHNKKPHTAIYVEKVAATDSFMAALLSPLAQILPISASTNERLEGSNALNRHTVLHGESLNYGTKINSLKAISYINYVAHVLERQCEDS